METETKTLEQVVEYCQFHNFPAEIVGSWVWLSFESKPPAETISLLKEYGFRYSLTGKCSYFSHGLVACADFVGVPQLWAHF